MRSIRLTLFAVFTIVLAAGCTVHKNEAVIEQANAQCWVKVYQADHFGSTSATIRGPIALPTLDDLEGTNWTDEIESLVVGPEAEVQVWKSANYVGTAQTFRRGQKVDELDDLDLESDIGSLKVICR